jgi:hypothetical protein
MMDAVGRKTLPVEINTNGALFYCAVSHPVTSGSIFRTKKSIVLDRQSKSENFVLMDNNDTVEDMKEYS